MARPRLPAARVPTPSPWIVRAEPAANVGPATAGGEAAPKGPTTSSYLIRSTRPPAPGGADLPLALGIGRLADATMMAAAPDLAAALLALLTAPGLLRHDLDPQARAAVTAAWDLLVRVAPHLEI